MIVYSKCRKCLLQCFDQELSLFKMSRTPLSSMIKMIEKYFSMTLQDVGKPYVSTMRREAHGS